MMEKSPLSGRVPSGLAFVLLVAAQVVCLWRNRTPILEDDVLFFLRYVDNLASGQGYRFNVGEPPVCGASAPLWPLLVVPFKFLGLSSEHALLVLSVLLSLGATLLLGWVMHRRFGPIGVLTLIPALVVSHRYSTWATSGMESPLTFLLVAGALAVASGMGSWLSLGTVAGLCLVHKLDLAPLGLVLLGGAYLWRRETFWRATALAGALAAVWFSFATLYFGVPLPNSFFTKLGATYGEMERSWFVQTAFWSGGAPVRTVLALVGLVALRRHPYVACVAAAQVLVPTAGYTLHPPREAFAWYVAAISPALAILAGSGLALLLWVPGRSAVSLRHAALALGVVLLLGGWLERRDRPFVSGWHRYLLDTQLPMKRAGLWVAENVPEDARVATGWGNPAYYSRRFVYDRTFLNRRKGSTVVDPLVEFQPEVLIDHAMKPFAEYRPPSSYHVVKVFEGIGRSPSFVAVLLHDEPDVSTPAEVRSGFLEGLAEALETPEDPESARRLERLRVHWSRLDDAERERLVHDVPGVQAWLGGE